MTIGDFNGDGEFNVGDVTGWWGLSNQQRLVEQQAKSNELQAKSNALLAGLAAEQRRLQSLPSCPACKKPVETDSRLCANCRSPLSWVGDHQPRLPSIRGEEQDTLQRWHQMKAQLETARTSSLRFQIESLRSEIDDLVREWRSQISIATGRWGFLEENFGWGPKAEARAGTVV